MPKQLDQVEEWARRMMETALAAPVTQHDDGSQDGMHDLSIRYVDGRQGSVEVTCAVDGSVLALSKAIYGRTGDRGRWIIPGIQGGWSVVLSRTAKGKELEKSLPALLGDLESAGEGLIDTRGGPSDTPFVRRARDLGIVHLSQSGTSFQGSVYPVVGLTSERSGGMLATAADAAARWIGLFLRDPKQADVLAKLQRSKAEERHAFVIIAGLGEPTFEVFDPLTRQDVQPPSVSPSLPGEVTHVWLTTTWNGGRGLRWDPEAGWLWFDRLAEPLEGSG